MHDDPRYKPVAAILEQACGTRNSYRVVSDVKIEAFGGAL
jgi:hypothetical protein